MSIIMCYVYMFCAFKSVLTTLFASDCLLLYVCLVLFRLLLILLALRSLHCVIVILHLY